MRKELDEKLCADFPGIFAQRHKSMRETAMCWGFDCGDGWHQIIRNLCMDIKKLVDTFNKANSARDEYKVEAVQVKEKFGTLRFYIGGVHKDIFSIVHALIDHAEHLSGQTCEECGEYGEVRNGGWIRTLCTKHAFEHKYPIKEWELKYIPEEEQKNAVVVDKAPVVSHKTVTVHIPG